MTIYVILSVARQVQGEFLLVKSEKAFSDKNKAEEFYNQLIKKYTEEIETPSGKIKCVCERAIFEMEMD